MRPMHSSSPPQIVLHLSKLNLDLLQPENNSGLMGYHREEPNNAHLLVIGEDTHLRNIPAQYTMTGMSVDNQCNYPPLGSPPDPTNLPPVANLDMENSVYRPMSKTYYALT